MTPTAPARPPAVDHRSTRGAKILTALGALVCLGGLVLGVVIAVQFVRLLPLDVLGPDGAPGSAVVAVVEAPGTADARLEAGRYAIVLTQRQPVGSGGLASDLSVTAPDGTAVATDARPQVSMHASRGSYAARSVGAFVAAEPGIYTVTAPRMADGTPATVMLTKDQDVAPFVTGIVSTVFGLIAVIVVGLLGCGMLLGGIVWWVMARRPRVR